MIAVPVAVADPVRDGAPMTRWRAFLIHLAISVAICVGVTFVLVGLWYPPPLFSAAGGHVLALTIIGVDMVLGPLLTLIVFKPGKWGLKFDLWCIGTLQATALAYGLYVMFESRPVYLAGAIDRFEVVAANQIPRAQLERAPAPYRRLSWTGYRLVGVALPTDPALRNELLDWILIGIDAHQLPWLYVPYEQVAGELAAAGRPPRALLTGVPEALRQAERLARRAGLDLDQTVLLPLQARARWIAILLERDSGRMLGLVDVDVWELEEASAAGELPLALLGGGAIG